MYSRLGLHKKEMDIQKTVGLLLLVAAAGLVQAQQPAPTEFYKSVGGFVNLKGHKIKFLKGEEHDITYGSTTLKNGVLPYISTEHDRGRYIPKEKAATSKYKISYKKFVGRTGTVVNVDTQTEFLELQMDDDGKTVFVGYERDKIEPVYGILSELDSARKHLIGKVFYDKENAKVVIKDVQFVGEVDKIGDRVRPAAFRIEVERNGEKVYWEKSVGSAYTSTFDSDVFGYDLFLKPTTAPLTKADVPYYFVVRKNKVDNVTEYVSMQHAREGTQVIYEDMATLAPIVKKSKTGVTLELIGQYYGDGFIWHKQMKVTVDETSFLTTPGTAITKVRDDGNIFERMVYKAPKDIAIIKAIADNYTKDVALRFIAEKGRKDYDMELSDEAKLNFKRAYELYLLLKKGEL
jgi:hypothetical protein